MLGKDLEHIINTAFKDARNLGHECITLEHLLLALLQNHLIIELLLACDANLTRLRHNLIEYLNNNLPRPSLQRNSTATPEIQSSVAFKKVLQRAMFQAQAAGQTAVLSTNVLIAMLSETDSHCTYLLKQESITRSKLLRFMMNSNSQDRHHLKPEETNCHLQQDLSIEAEESLKEYTTNLNVKAQQGLIDPVIGREEELARTIQVLCRRRKNNPLLVGEAGVGKTAIAEGLAQAIVNKLVPEKLANTVIYELDLGSLLAGTKYRGEFEKRLKTVLAQIKQQAGAIIFIDEIHIIIGAGATTGSLLDAANLIKPLLSAGELTCIGATTYKEYRTIFEKDHALARRFQKITIKEPSVEQTIKILQGLKSRFEAHHNIKYSDEALIAAVQLADRYITERKLPDKAIDVIDEVGAQQHLLAKSPQQNKQITATDITNIVAKIANIPITAIAIAEHKNLKNMATNLKRLIYGQDESIDILCNAVKIARSGLRDSNKPIGSFLFIGPTGVGKTELCKQLAKLINIELLRFDMSEYMEKHTISRLIGAPPGYLGYSDGGLLTEAVNSNRHALVLFDEIEKAHPDLLNLLLQIMDNGSLTDANGRTVDFHHTIIILTSNAGATNAEKNNIGFNKDYHHDLMPIIKDILSAELRNRLDAIIQFKALQKNDLMSIVDRFIAELSAQLKNQQVELIVDKHAKEWLAIHGYDKHMGARPISKLIEEQIKQQLADNLLFGKLNRGGRVLITEDNDAQKLKLSIAK
jgi:ATP-dependent Clp protease ATP-binding subunit ClpA